MLHIKWSSQTRFITCSRVGGGDNLSTCTKCFINLKDAVRRNTTQLNMCKPKRTTTAGLAILILEVAIKYCCQSVQICAMRQVVFVLPFVRHDDIHWLVNCVVKLALLHSSDLSRRVCVSLCACVWWARTWQSHLTELTWSSASQTACASPLAFQWK